MTDTSCHILSLAFAARHNTDHFRAMIPDSAAAFWQDTDQRTFEYAFDEILRNTIDIDGLEHLFRLCLGAGFLLNGSRPSWVKRVMAEKVRLHTLLEQEVSCLETGSWVKVPVLVAASGTALVKWVLAGMIENKKGQVFIPRWAQRSMDERFLGQAEKARNLVHRIGPVPAGKAFILFPLAPAQNTIQFTGGSAALPLALAFKSLAARRVLSSSLVATGCLDDFGGVLPVGHLDLKIEAAKVWKFKCLICPAGNRPRTSPSGMAPVAEFSQAWTMASLYSGRQDNLLFDFSRSLGHPDAFIDKMDSLPEAWITQEKEAVERLLSRIFNSMPLFERFSRKFGTMVEAFRVHRTRALSDLAPDPPINEWPLASLKWCMANLSLANHQGRIKDARCWEARGAALIEPVLKLNINLAADFFNHAMVAAHNRFDFSFDLPGPLARLLDVMEQRYGFQKKHGCFADPVLGRLYGTLAQNAAFCGPEHMKTTEKLSLKARKALGEDLSSEFECEWLRQYDYLASARLAAGDMEGAKACLEIYLGITAIDEVPARLDGFSCWQISLICRFLAVARPKGMENTYHALVLHLTDHFSMDHPWQLSFFNLARTALGIGDRKNAVRFFKKSLDICLTTDLGPTVEIMALKPLAYLADLCPRDLDFSGPEERMKHAAAQLNPTHFAFLADRPFPAALDHVRENPGRCFPFSYA